MKTLLLLLFLSSSACLSIAQSFNRQISEIETFISVNDKRSLGYWYLDTSTVGHLSGDVSVTRTTPRESEQNKGKLDSSTSAYQIHFYRMYQDTLRSYTMIHVGVDDFDKASYKWINDTIVRVTLMNSMNGENASYKLTQVKGNCCSAGLLFN